MRLVILLASALLLAGCGGGETLPDPAATPFPKPPAILMTPPERLRTIPLAPENV